MNRLLPSNHKCAALVQNACILGKFFSNSAYGSASNFRKSGALECPGYRPVCS